MNCLGFAPFIRFVVFYCLLHMHSRNGLQSYLIWYLMWADAAVETLLNWHCCYTMKNKWRGKDWIASSVELEVNPWQFFSATPPWSLCSCSLWDPLTDAALPKLIPQGLPIGCSSPSTTPTWFYIMELLMPASPHYQNLAI